MHCENKQISVLVLTGWWFLNKITQSGYVVIGAGPTRSPGSDLFVLIKARRFYLKFCDMLNYTTCQFVHQHLTWYHHVILPIIFLQFEYHSFMLFSQFLYKLHFLVSVCFCYQCLISCHVFPVLWASAWNKNSTVLEALLYVHYMHLYVYMWSGECW